jgi:hypothetical protein
MGGAPAGNTLLNQPAYEQVSTRHGQQFVFEETEIVLKHEGPTLAYKVKRTVEAYEAAVPSWMNNPSSPSTDTPGAGPK